MTKLILRLEIEELIDECAAAARRLQRNAARKRNQHWRHHLPLLLNRLQGFRSYCSAELDRLNEWRSDEADPADILYGLHCLHSRVSTWMRTIMGQPLRRGKKRKRNT